MEKIRRVGKISLAKHFFSQEQHFVFTLKTPRPNTDRCIFAKVMNWGRWGGGGGASTSFRDLLGSKKKNLGTHSKFELSYHSDPDSSLICFFHIVINRAKTPYFSSTTQYTTWAKTISQVYFGGFGRAPRTITISYTTTSYYIQTYGT